MREIITVQIGGFGIKLGESYWNLIGKEHKINREGFPTEAFKNIMTNNAEILYDCLRKEKYCPHVVFADSDSISMDNIISNKLYNQENFCVGKYSSKGIWPTGFYSESLENFMDIFRKNAEKCNHISAFQFFNSLTGGTGGGFGSKILEEINGEYQKIIQLCYFHTPSTKFNENILEIYNTLLSLKQISENNMLAIIINNESLKKHPNLPISTTSNEFYSCPIIFSQYNELISQNISNITASLRFGGLCDFSPLKAATSLKLFPRLSFITTNYAQLFMPKHGSSLKLPITPNIEQIMFNFQHSISGVNTSLNKFMTGLIYSPGNIPTYIIDSQISEFIQNHTKNVQNWIEDPFKAIYSNNYDGNYHITMLANHGQIRENMQNWVEEFTKGFRRKVNLHWYLQEGMDEMQFCDAESSTNDIISEYCACAETPALSEGPGSDNEEEEI